MTPAKCPNPHCPFLFDPSQVPPGVVIACPQCGTQFTLGPPAPAPAPAYQAGPPGYPANYGAPPGYPPAPDYPGTDLGAAPGPDVLGMADEPRAAGGPPARPRKSGLGGTVLALGGIVLLVAVVLGVVVLAAVSRKGQMARSGGGAGDELRKPELNFAFRRPAGEWLPDATAQNALGVNVFGYRRAGPDGWVALAVRDYATLEPRPSELKDKAVNDLHKGFDNLPPDLSTEPAELSGQKAERIAFRGVYKPTGEACVGDCTLLAYKGVAYWFYSWCPENAAAEVDKELTALRDGFRTLDQRDRWKPTTVAEKVYRNKSGLFRVTDYERVWNPPKQREAADEDSKADLLLDGDLKAQGTGKRRAELAVLVLDGGGDPLTAGRAYVEARYKKLREPVAVKFEELTGDLEGDPPVGPEDPDAKAVRLKMTVGTADDFRAADKLVVLSAVDAEGKTVVAEASCPWKDRAAWERRLVQLVGSLRPGE